jgi:sigma-B regulation protein RsbU (phosphoserine phosphatase)
MQRLAEVRVRAEDGTERQVRLKPRTVIGRAEDCDIYFPDDRLSRHHAEIELRPEGCFLVDLDSTNGTYLNGERVEAERRLARGDRITAGDATLVFEERELKAFGGSVPAAAPSAMRLTRSVIDVGQLVKDDRVLGALSRVTSALVAHSTLPDLYGRILDLVLEIIPAERGAILHCEGAPPVPTIKAARGAAGQEISTSIVNRAIDGRVALLFHDVLEDPSLRERPSIVAGAIQAAMCAPLWLPREQDGAEVLGVIYLDSHAENPFSENDLHVLTVLANFLATKLESVRLAEENLERRRLEQDVRIAGEIQARLLPQGPPRLPGWDVAGTTRPSFLVGGDYYDFALDPERLHFALADVSGHGVAAALLMVDLRATVRAYWREERMAAAMVRVNQRFLDSVPWDKYATLFLARLEVATGRVVYVNAGHNRPLLLRAAGGVEVLAEGGTVLGAFADSAWSEGATTLERGDTLLVFSDGVSETWPDAESADCALIDLARTHGSAGAGAIEAAVFAELDRHSGDRTQDDRTLIVIRRL